jgi:hypothetical protein
MTRMLMNTLAEIVGPGKGLERHANHPCDPGRQAGGQWRSLPWLRTRVNGRQSGVSSLVIDGNAEPPKDEIYSAFESIGARSQLARPIPVAIDVIC